MALSMGVASVPLSRATSMASSSSTFVRAVPNPSLAPVSGVSSAPRVKARVAVSPKCASTQPHEEVARVVAAGAAALAVFCSCSGGALAIAAPERAGQKSQEILKSAEKMDMRDAPNWFGSGRVRSEQNPSKKGGIASAPDLRKGADDAVGKTQDTAGNIASKARDSARDILGRAKSAVGGGVANISDGGDVASNVQQGAKGAINQAQGKKGQVESGVKDAIGQAQRNSPKLGGGGSLVDSVQQGLQGKKGEAESGVKDAIGQAQRNAPKPGGDGGSLVDSVQQGLQGIKETVTDKASDVKGAVDDAASNAQGKLNLQ